MGKIADLFASLSVRPDARSFSAADKLLGAVKGALVGLAAAASVHWAAGLVEQTIEAGSHINDLSQAAGVNAEALQTLGYAAQQNSSNVDDMAGGLQKLARNMFESVHGNKAAADSFRQMGIRVTDAHGALRPTEDVLADIADHFASMPDGAEKTAKAISVLGRSGAGLIPTLNVGSKGLEEYARRARELGAVIDKDGIAKLDQLGDTGDELKASLTGLRNTVVVGLAPTLQGLANDLMQWIAANRELIAQGLTTVVHGLVAGLRGFARGVSVVVSGVRWLSKHTGVATTVLEALGAAFVVLKFTAIDAAFAAGAAWVASTAGFALFVAGIAGAIYGVQKLYEKIKSGEGVAEIWHDITDSMKAAWGDFCDWADSKFGALAQSIKDKASDIADDAANGTGFWSLPGVHQLGQLGKGIGHGARKLTNFGTDLGHELAMGNRDDYTGQGMSVREARADNAEEDRRAAFVASMRPVASVPGGGGRPVSNSFNAEITVHAKSGADAKEIASEAARAVQRLWDSNMRDAAAGTGGAGS